METPLVPKQFGELCQACSEQQMEAPWVDALLSKPPLRAIFRPTMWRFYGPGDELRRATWFLDTQRHGLQPYGEDAQAVLEDAYLFLKWVGEKGTRDESILLTVQVPSPDGSETQLVQFSSLVSATAIGKGFRGAISLFKQRVYRGAYHSLSNSSQSTTTSEEEESAPVYGRNERNTTVEEAQNCIPAGDGTQIRRTTGKKEPVTDQVSEPKPTTAHTVNQGHEPEMDVEELKELNERNFADQTLDQSIPLSFRLPKMENERNKATSTDVDDETVDHLVLIVHGIGEMLLNFDLFRISKVPTIVDCCGFLRKNHEEVLNVRFSQMYQTLDGIQRPRRGRVE